MVVHMMPIFAASLGICLLFSGHTSAEVIGRIDTHHHFIPDFYKAYLRDHDSSLGPASDLPLPDWSPEASLAMMDKAGIAAAILSISSPGLPYGEPKAVAKLVRQLNEYGAEMVKQHPGRFGFFATLPMPDVEACLEEARYALDTLRADGVVLLGNVQGKYFSEKEFHPLLAELNRRKTTLYVHPNFLPGGVQPGIPPWAADFTLDSVRAAFIYVATGAAEEFTDLRVLLSHAGGFMPFAAARLAMGISGLKNGLDNAVMSEAELDLLRGFYIDTALSASPFAFPSILAFTTPEHMTYGSDFPFAASVQPYFDGQLDARFANDSSALTRISSGTAAELFPALVKRMTKAAGHDAAEL